MINFTDVDESLSSSSSSFIVMPTLSFGLNVAKKSPRVGTRPPPAKRKTIFVEDSAPEDGPEDDDAEQIDSIGGLKTLSSKAKKDTARQPPKRPPISQYGDLSTSHTTARHAKNAQVIDPSVYDYDSIYDSLHAKPSSNPSAALADQEQKPKYMSDLLAAAEVRRRDQLRAKEKMLARERELEGDEFANKDKFVTGAYKRQQEEMRRLEAEEVAKEKEAEERKKREGGGLKGLYKNMLERNEQKHAAIVKAVEEAKLRGPGAKDGEASGTEVKEGKSEADLAKEKGAIVNEDGQVVDKRQLLIAGLNASSTSKPAPHSKGPSMSRAGGSSRGEVSGGRGGNKEFARERETRLFEERLLGKRAHPVDNDDDDDNESERASKSRKMEEEILGRL